MHNNFTKLDESFKISGISLLSNNDCVQRFAISHRNDNDKTVTKHKENTNNDKYGLRYVNNTQHDNSNHKSSIHEPQIELNHSIKSISSCDSSASDAHSNDNNCNNSSKALHNNTNNTNTNVNANVNVNNKHISCFSQCVSLANRNITQTHSLHKPLPLLDEVTTPKIMHVPTMQNKLLSICTISESSRGQSFVNGRIRKRNSIIAINDIFSQSLEAKLASHLATTYKFKSQSFLLSKLDDINNKEFAIEHNQKYPQLTLENIPDKQKMFTYQNLNKLTINPYGLKQSIRKANDTITFFGYNENDKVNDCVVDNSDFIYNPKTFTKTFLAIVYDTQFSKYFIQPVKDKNKYTRFIWVKVQEKENMVFISEKVVKIGTNYLHMTPEGDNKTLLTVLIYDDAESSLQIKEPRKASFSGLVANLKITIGSSKETSCRLKHNTKVAKVHCEIQYDKERGLWILENRYMEYIKDDNKSINYHDTSSHTAKSKKNNKGNEYDTWVALDSKTVVNKHFVFKIGCNECNVNLTSDYL